MFTRISQRLSPLAVFLRRPPVVLAVISLLTYGIFIPLLKFYWDDLAIHWIADVYGTQGLARYFSTNRPVWGFIYQLNYRLIGETPWLWQIFGIFWRWAAATSLYYFLYLFWDRRKEPAIWGALLFLVYPGFGQQAIAMVYGHFFLVLTAFFSSLALTLLAIQAQHHKQWLHLLSALLAALNLFSMEYFFMLELLRPLLIWYSLSRMAGEPKIPRLRLKQSILIWAPYALVLLAASIWRAFIFNFQTANYQPQMLDLLRSEPLSGLWQILLLAGKDFFTTQIAAWGLVFQFKSFDGFGRTAVLMMAILAFLTLVYLVVTFSNLRFQTGQITDSGHGWLKPGLLIALSAFLLAGIPFWLTGLPVNLVFPYDRLTIPFILSFSILWVTFFFALPITQRLRNTLLSILVVLACAHQVQTGIKFQRDWDVQARFLWQLTWRVPALEPGTILYSHVLPITYSSDNSLSAVLNWTYNPGGNGQTVDYLLSYPEVRLGGSLGTLESNQTIRNNLLVGVFEGNTSHSLALTYQPPGCLRILDPEIEIDNWVVPEEVRDTLRLVDNDRILADPQARPPAFLYQPEPQPNWCYYFEKADLARQWQNWPEVIRLGELAFALDDRPNDPAEWMPFIEAYAHREDWQTASELTTKSAQITNVMNPVLCRLWQRIERETHGSDTRDSTIKEMQELLSCQLIAGGG